MDLAVLLGLVLAIINHLHTGTIVSSFHPGAMIVEGTIRSQCGLLAIAPSFIQSDCTKATVVYRSGRLSYSRDGAEVWWVGVAHAIDVPIGPMVVGEDGSLSVGGNKVDWYFQKPGKKGGNIHIKANKKKKIQWKYDMDISPFPLEVLPAGWP